MKIHNSEIFKITIYDFNPSYLEKHSYFSLTTENQVKMTRRIGQNSIFFVPIVAN